MSKIGFNELLGSILQKTRKTISLIWLLEAKIKGVQFGSKVKFVGRPLISVANNSRLYLDDEVTVFNSLRSNPLGCFQPSVLRTLAPGAELILGRKTGISAAVICAGCRIEIGEGTIIGSGAMIIDNDFHAPAGDYGWRNEYQENARPIKIGKGVFIGARAIILKGVTIGDRALIGAGAVVSKDVPAGYIAAGNPARIFPPKPVA